MKTLVTGAGAGLGRFLAEYFDAEYRLTRANAAMTLAAARRCRSPLRIIHAAFPRPGVGSAAEIVQTLNDTTRFTEQVAALRCTWFHFISSIDVYPRDGGGMQTENTPVALGCQANAYGFLKLCCEAIVAQRQRRHSILRCSALLGQHMRPNSLWRLLYEARPVLTLSPLSRFNYVSYASVGRFVEACEEHNAVGIYNLASSRSIGLAEIARRGAKRVKWGRHRYDAGTTRNLKARGVLPELGATSLKVVQDFERENRTETI